MTYAELANPGILTQPVYEPGKPIETVARELGLDPAGIIKLASNENPSGPSPKALAAAQRALQDAQLAGLPAGRHTGRSWQGANVCWRQGRAVARASGNLPHSSGNEH